MLLQTNSYVVPKNRRHEHERLMRRFRQTLARLGCDQFEVYEQVGANWATGENGRYVQIMRFRDRKHQLAVQTLEKTDPAAQALISEFCDLVNFTYQQQQGLFAVGFYNSTLPVFTKRPRPSKDAANATAARIGDATAPADALGAAEPAASEATTLPKEVFSEETTAQALSLILGKAAGEDVQLDAMMDQIAAQAEESTQEEETPQSEGATIEELPAAETSGGPENAAPEVAPALQAGGQPPPQDELSGNAEPADDTADWEAHLPLSPVDELAEEAPLPNIALNGSANDAFEPDAANEAEWLGAASGASNGVSSAGAGFSDIIASQASALDSIPPQLLDFEEESDEDDAEFEPSVESHPLPELGDAPETEETVDLSSNELGFADAGDDLLDNTVPNAAQTTDRATDFSNDSGIAPALDAGLDAETTDSIQSPIDLNDTAGENTHGDAETDDAGSVENAAQSADQHVH